MVQELVITVSVTDRDQPVGGAEVTLLLTDLRPDGPVNLGAGITDSSGAARIVSRADTLTDVRAAAHTRAGLFAVIFVNGQRTATSRGLSWSDVVRAGNAHIDLQADGLIALLARRQPLAGTVPAASPANAAPPPVISAPRPVVVALAQPTGSSANRAATADHAPARRNVLSEFHAGRESRSRSQVRP